MCDYFTLMANLVLRRLQILVIFILASAGASGQGKPNGILFITCGKEYEAYGDVVTHLKGLLAGTEEYGTSAVESKTGFFWSRCESLADAYYSRILKYYDYHADIKKGYKHVIFIPALNEFPTSNFEVNGDYLDDAPFDNQFFAPEAFYEGCLQFTKLALEYGTTPLILLPYNSDEDIAYYGPAFHRVANGVGIEIASGAHAVEAAGGAATTAAVRSYLYACSLFTKLTGLNAATMSYVPSALSAEDYTALATQAYQTELLQSSTLQYDTSYETEGAVVYRSLDPSVAPYNNTVHYRYKGTSTHDRTSNAIQAIVNNMEGSTTAVRKLGTQNGTTPVPYRTRYWHAADLPLQAGAISADPGQAAFMYVSGSIMGSASAEELMALDQPNMIPMVFDWIKAFGFGTGNTLDNTINGQSCSAEHYNFVERGWKLIPLASGLARLREVMPHLVVSHDGIHMSDKLNYMNAYMMLSSAFGTELPLPTALSDYTLHEAGHTVEELQLACQVGHQVLKEHAFLSETGEYVPDSDLSIPRMAFPEVTGGVPYSFSLTATGGDGNYSWKLLSDLPEGLSLSPDGTISGTAAESFAGDWYLSYQVTDGTGAFRKQGTRLRSAMPMQAYDMEITATSANAFAITLPWYPANRTAVTYSRTAPVSGTLRGTAPFLTYTPAAGMFSDRFTYTLTVDGVTTTGTVRITAPTLLVGYDFDAGDGTVTTSPTAQHSGVTASSYEGARTLNPSLPRGLVSLVENSSNGLSELADAEGANFGTATPISFGGTRPNFGFSNDGNSADLAGALNDNSYMTFTVTPKEDMTLSLSQFSFRSKMNHVNRSADYWALYSSVDGFEEGNEIATGMTGITYTYANHLVDLSDERFQNLDVPVTFRLYIHGGAGNALSETLFDKLILKGSVFDASAIGTWLQSQGLVEGELNVDSLDGDGRDNLLEFIFNKNPKRSDKAPVTLSATGEAYSFTRRIDSASETSQVVQVSEDLINWEDVPLSGSAISITPSGDGVLEEVSVDLSDYQGNGRKLFVRLAAERASL